MKKQLKDVCEGFTKNIAQKDLSENNGKYPIFGASGIIKTIDFYISDKPYIGIVKDGSGVGRTNKYPAKSSLLGTMQYILPNQGIDLDYLMYGIRFLHLGENYSGAAIPHIYFKVYKNRTLDFPELAEQKHRSIVLNKIQDAINVKEKQLFELENIIQSEFVEMFGNKNFPTQKWDSVFITKTGKLDSNAMVEGGKYPFFTCAKEIFSIDNYAFDQEALLLAGNNAAGKYDVKYYKGKFNAYQRTYVLSLKEAWSYRLFQFQLEDKLLYLKEQSKGINTKFLTLKILQELEFIIPPKELQLKFETFVQQIDKSKFVLQQQLQFIKKYVIMTSWRKICFYTTVAM